MVRFCPEKLKYGTFCCENVVNVLWAEKIKNLHGEPAPSNSNRNGSSKSWVSISSFLPSWSKCSFPAFTSEVDTNYIFRVLSIPSDPFQELHMLQENDTESGKKNFHFHKIVKA